MKDLKPISESLFKRLALKWAGKKAILLEDYKNIANERIPAGTEVTITGRYRDLKGYLNIKDENTYIEIYGVHRSKLSYIKDEHNS